MKTIRNKLPLQNNNFRYHKKNRKRKNTELVLRQNKEMLDMMKKNCELQERGIAAQEAATAAIKEVAELLKITNEKLGKSETYF